MPDGADVPLHSPDVLAEIRAGLGARTKTLPAKLFYDEEGCRLFGLITHLDEYYVTRAEMALLRAQAPAIVAAAPAETLVEYGASDETKADLLLAEGTFDAYVPIDIAPGALDALSERLAAMRPNLVVTPVVADFTQPLTLSPFLADTRICGFFPGSTIGNFDPEGVITFLDGAARTLAGADGTARLVVGTDLRKDPALLIAAYDDASGVTAAFNKNMLVHVNRIAGADFDIDAFRHVAAWNDAQSRIEMHLVSLRPQSVRAAGHTYNFAEGESIHTESSYKHTPEAFRDLAAQAGWQGRGFWTDPDCLFGIHLLERPGALPLDTAESKRSQTRST